MKVFFGARGREGALPILEQAGWRLRDWQAGGDYEDFVRLSGDPGLLLVDFALGRFILYKEEQNKQTKLLTHESDADGDPEFDAVLNAVFEDRPEPVSNPRVPSPPQGGTGAVWARR